MSHNPMFSMGNRLFTSPNCRIYCSGNDMLWGNNDMLWGKIGRRAGCPQSATRVGDNAVIVSQYLIVASINSNSKILLVVADTALVRIGHIEYDIIVCV